MVHRDGCQTPAMPAEPAPFNSNGSLKDFTGLKIIGKGTFGKVYKATRLEDNKDYAIKELRIGSMTPKEREDALNEVRVLASMTSNPYTIRWVVVVVVIVVSRA
mmetsp:Transcript_42470/g.113700  ORF Transcript_42470/g.113700 Transcript_42470/m.113700 type:complete len:104 (-) Transcript_42470:768-1079(-)